MEKELQEGDWDALVLHLLGMDHVGHLQGAHSALMPAKQREYDALVRQIYDAVAATDAPGHRTLVVVCGDHGMTDAGNHGGSTDAELDTAALFISPVFADAGTAHGGASTVPVAANEDEDEKEEKKEKDKDAFGARARQVDVCPTLCALLGLPFPAENSGRVIPAVLRAVEPSVHTRVATLRANAAQLRSVLTANGGIDANMRALHTAAERAYAHAQEQSKATSDSTETATEAEEAETRYNAFLAAAGERLGSRWGAVDWHRVCVGALVLGAATTAALLLLWAVLAPGGPLAPQQPAVRATLGMLGAVTSLVYAAHLLVCSPSVAPGSQGSAGSTQSTAGGACEENVRNVAGVVLSGFGLACALLPLLGVRAVQHFFLHRAGAGESATVLDMAAVTSSAAASASGSTSGTSSTSSASASASAAATAAAKEVIARYVPPPYPEGAEMALIAGGSLVHALSYFGSSYVEGERAVVVFLLNTAYAFYTAFTAVRALSQSRARPRDRTALLALLGSCLAGRAVAAWDAGRAAAWPVPVQRALVVVAVLALFVYAVATTRALRAFLGRARWLFAAALALAYAFLLALKLPGAEDRSASGTASSIALARAVMVCAGLAGVVALGWPRLGGRGARATGAGQHITHELAVHAVLPLLLLYNRRANALLLALVAAQAALFVRAAGALEDGFCRARTAAARTAVLLWMARGAFFAFGNSNSVATIDLGGAYAGLARYRPAAVGAQAFALLYTGPLVVGLHVASACYRLARPQGLRAPDALEQAALEQAALAAALTAAVLYQLGPLAAALASLVLQHAHLFVWSVFAPKFVYASLDALFAAVLCALLCTCAFVARLHLVRYSFRERRAYAALRKRLESESMKDDSQSQQQPQTQSAEDHPKPE